MSLNIAPVYGKQYIRYAETFEAATDTEAGGIGTVEIGEFRAVHYATYAGANKVAPGSAFTLQPEDIVGINQAYIPTALAQPYTARQASVATSGLLLVEVDPAATLADITLNSQLEIDAAGRAVAPGDGIAVLLNNTKPLIREQVGIGGRKFVLVSFA
jgi:hypothetical protein